MALVSPGATCWGMFRANLKKLILSTRYLPCVRFCTEESNPFNDVLKKPRSLEDLERRSNVEVSDEPESVLKTLKTANVTPLYDARKDGVRTSVLTLPSAVLGSTSCAGPLASTLFIRDFYHRYFNLLRKEDKSVVIGNPGVSKFWFQWYILYRLVNEKEIPNLRPNYLNSREPPKVIVRQVGDSKLFFIFLSVTRYTVPLQILIVTILIPTVHSTWLNLIHRMLNPVHLCFNHNMFSRSKAIQRVL